MTHGSLFSGIGGFELGAEMAGIKTLWSCEIVDYNRKVLSRHYPETKIYEDVRDLHNPPAVDIISGGFPCQDISQAGYKIGINGNRSGLWSEFARIICEVRPSYAIIENSPALANRGLCRVLSDLARIGYDAEWECISNAEFGFCHHRQRIYIIAYPSKIRDEKSIPGNVPFKKIFTKRTSEAHIGFDVSERFRQIPESDSIRVGDGVSNWLHRVGACGNAVNPVVANYLFNCIKLHSER